MILHALSKSLELSYTPSAVGNCHMTRSPCSNSRQIIPSLLSVLSGLLFYFAKVYLASRPVHECNVLEANFATMFSCFRNAKVASETNVSYADKLASICFRKMFLVSKSVQLTGMEFLCSRAVTSLVYYDA